MAHTNTVSPTLSIVVTTTSRPTLAQTLRSIRFQDFRVGDEVLLVCDGPQPTAVSLWNQLHLPGRVIHFPDGPHGYWGHVVRNATLSECKGDFILAMDDDDIYTPGALTAVRKAVAENPTRPHIFRMSNHPAVGTVWKVKEIKDANVGTPMFCFPNVQEKLGRYGMRYCGDLDFCSSTCEFYPDGPVWRDEVICKVRPHEVGEG